MGIFETPAKTVSDRAGGVEQGRRRDAGQWHSRHKRGTAENAARRSETKEARGKAPRNDQRQGCP
eukprot:11909945-Alexandrium_andersonii.AAC.1